jgi:ribosomal protein S2
MGKIVNLNKFRKQKARAEREKQADTNRRLHGRTKAERLRDHAQKERLQKQVDGARLEPPKTED